jgi:hypothetical protein
MFTRSVLIFLLLILIGTLNIYADETTTDFSKGPLYGKNLFLPILVHYNFPSLPAKSGERQDFQYHFSFYYVQDVHYHDVVWEGRRYEKSKIKRDYESWVAELGFAYNFRKELQAGMDMRLFSYYGGFLDPFLEKYHRFFGFPNAEREKFLQNQLYINVPYTKNQSLFLSTSAISFGDIDLWAKWTFLENRRLSLAAMGAFKLPTGNLSTLSGSGYPDLALGLLMDFRANKFFTLHAQAGGIVPLNNVQAMFNGLLGLEIHPSNTLSANMQLNVKTSPISEDTVHFYINRDRNTIYKRYSKPQVNLLVGLVLQKNAFKWQFYIEEDLAIYRGTDITFNLMVSHSINFGKISLREN